MWLPRGVGAPVPPRAIVGKAFLLTLPASLTNQGPALSTTASLVTAATNDMVTRVFVIACAASQ